MGRAAVMASARVPCLVAFIRAETLLTFSGDHAAASQVYTHSESLLLLFPRATISAKRTVIPYDAIPYECKHKSPHMERYINRLCLKGTEGDHVQS